MATNNDLGNMIINVSLDDSQFTNGMDNINRSLKTSKSAMRAHIAQLEAVGDHLGALEANLEGLNTQYTLNQRKQEELNRKYQQAVQTYGAASDQAQKYARKINDTTRELRALESRMENVQGQIDDFSDSLNDTETAFGRFNGHLDKAKDNVGKFADKLRTFSDKNMSKFLGATAAIAGGFTAISTAAVQAKQDMDNVDAQTAVKLGTDKGGSKEAQGKAKKATEAAYKTGLTDDMGAANEAAIDYTRNFKDESQETINSLTQQGMVLEESFGADRQEMLATMNALMTNFGMTGQEAMDYITKGYQQNLDINGDMLDSIKEFSPQYAEMGMTQYDVFDMMKQGVASGVKDFGLLGDTYKEFNIRATEGSEEFAETVQGLGPTAVEAYKKYQKGQLSTIELYQIIGQELDKIKDKQDQYAKGQILYGAPWEDGNKKEILESSKNKEKVEKTEKKDIDGAAAQALEDRLDNLSTKFQGVMNTLKLEVLLPLGEELMKIGEDILPSLTNHVPEMKAGIQGLVSGIQTVVQWVKDLIGWWNSLDGSTQTWIKRAALATGALAAFGIVMSPVARGFSILLGGVRGTITAFQKIMGVSKTVFGFFTKGASETSKFGSALNKVKGVATGAFNIIKAGGKGLFSVLKLGAKGLFTVLKVGVKGLLGPFGLVLTAITLLVEGFKYAYNHSEKFRNIVDKLWAKIKGVWAKIKALGFKGTINALWKAIKTAFSTGISFVVNKVKAFGNKIKESFNAVKSTVVGTVKGLWNNIKTHFSNGINAVKNGVSSFKNKITTTFTAVKNAVVGTVKGLWNNIKTNFTNGISIVKSKITGFKDKMLEVFRGIKSKVEEIVENIIDKVKAMPGKMADGIAKGKKALIDGAKKMLNGAIEGVEWGINKVIGGANKVLGFFGSDKKIEEVKLKKYAKGTPRGGHEGGLAMVNDGVGSNYKELITTPDGRSFVPEGRNVVMNLPKGSSVLNGEKTRQAMDMGMIPKYATGIGWLDKSFNWAKDKYNKVKDWGSEIWDLATDPSKLKEILANFVNKAIPEKFQKGFLPDLMGAASNKIMDFASKFLFKEKEEAELANDGVGGDFGNWKPFKGNFNKVSNKWGVYDYLYDLGQQIVEKFKGKYKGLHISSGLRSTSANTGGVVSDHVYGLGLDLARGGVRDNSYYEMAKTLSTHPYLKYVIGSNMWNTSKGGTKFVKYPYAKTSPHDNHLHLSAKNPSNAKKAGANSDAFGVGDYSASGKGAHGVSASGLKFIQSKEGYSPKWYDLGDGMLTIGWGTALSKSQAAAKGYKAGGTLPKETLQAMFENEVGKFASQVKSKLNAKGFKVNQNQFDMLVSYAYNRGMGGFNQLLNNSSSVSAMGSNITKYWGSNTKFYSGLIKRRKEEASIFKNGYADGGLITREQLAWVGEGNKPEAIIPLDKAKRGRAVKLLKETARVLGVSVNDGTGNSSTGSRSSGGSNTGLLTQLLAATLEQNQLLKQQNELIEKKELVVGDQAIYDSNKRIADKVNRQNNFSRGY